MDVMLCPLLSSSMNASMNNHRKLPFCLAFLACLWGKALFTFRKRINWKRSSTLAKRLCKIGIRHGIRQTVNLSADRHPPRQRVSILPKRNRTDTVPNGRKRATEVDAIVLTGHSTPAGILEWEDSSDDRHATTNKALHGSATAKILPN